MKKLISLFGLSLMILGPALAQDDSKPQLFAIHEDIVKPSKNGDFMEAMKNLKSACTEYSAEVNWTSVWYNDNSVIHLSPIENFGALDNNPFAPLGEKMGQDKMAAMWDAFDDCVESHRDIVVAYHADMSYLPNGPAKPEQKFRDIFFWNYEPGKEAEAAAINKEWVELFKSKGAKYGYMTYSMVMGDMPGYAYVSWATDRLDHATRSKTDGDIVGEEAGQLWEKALKITKKFSTKYGDVMPDISYSYSSE